MLNAPADRAVGVGDGDMCGANDEVGGIPKRFILVMGVGTGAGEMGGSETEI
jgi:hypothetical protein